MPEEVTKKRSIYYDDLKGYQLHLTTIWHGGSLQYL